MHLVTKPRAALVCGVFLMALHQSATAANVVVTLQQGLDSYAGMTDTELRDPVQGTIGATWYTVPWALGVQAN